MSCECKWNAFRVQLAVVFFIIHIKLIICINQMSQYIRDMSTFIWKVTSQFCLNWNGGLFLSPHQKVTPSLKIIVLSWKVTDRQLCIISIISVTLASTNEKEIRDENMVVHIGDSIIKSTLNWLLSYCVREIIRIDAPVPNNFQIGMLCSETKIGRNESHKSIRFYRSWFDCDAKDTCWIPNNLNILK